jgi:hypothetical protein
LHSSCIHRLIVFLIDVVAFGFFLVVVIFVAFVLGLE